MYSLKLLHLHEKSQSHCDRVVVSQKQKQPIRGDEDDDFPELHCIACLMLLPYDSDRHEVTMERSICVSEISKQQCQ